MIEFRKNWSDEKLDVVMSEWNDEKIDAEKHELVQQSDDLSEEV